MNRLPPNERGGRVTFMPMNRLRNPENISYPDSPDSIPMINKLKFDQKFQRAFVQVCFQTSWVGPFGNQKERT
jgi:structural maintenance of chromosome 3 (chondroitin sulfate proteoglycan 6)